MKYAKAVMHLLFAFAGALVTALGVGNNANFNSIDLKHWIAAIIVALGSSGVVLAVENIPGVAGTVAKAIVSFLSGGLASLVIALNDNHISQTELLVAFMAAVTAASAVYQTSNLVTFRGRRTVAPTTHHKA